MLKILDVTFPFFALVLLGWVAARQRWLPLDAIPGLNLFVLYLALPAMLLRFAAATPITRLFDPILFGGWLLCALSMVALAVALARRAGLSWNDGAFGALVAAFPNAGFMGVPLLVDLLGPTAAAPAIVALCVDMVVTSSLCIALSRLDLSSPGQSGSERGSGNGSGSGAGGAGSGASAAAAQALKGMATNPLPWAIAAGALLSAGALQLPHLIDRPLALLGDAASPTALFTLGAVLARARLQPPGGPHVTAPRGDLPAVVALKLLVHPLLVYAACHAAIAVGLPLDPGAARVLTLLAALPSASNVPMLAERFDADAGRIARIVLLTTTLAFGTFTVAVALLTG